MTPRELLLSAASRFRQAGIPDPETDSAWLLSSLCGSSPLSLRLDTDTVLSPSLLDAYESLAARRLAREPLQYILGSVSFCGLSLRVDPRVLIPRPETELLCSWVLESLSSPESAGFFPSPRILDLCCGSGCIGLALKNALPAAEVTLSDLSADALSVASANADLLGLSVRFNRGDLASGLPLNDFHLVVCNPPYIPSSECRSLQPEVLHEPLSALDGGVDGLDFYRRLARSVPSLLVPGGLLFLELGFGEAAPVSRLLRDAGFESVEIRQDFNRIDRMLRAVRP